MSSRLGVVAELRRADLAEDPLEQFRRWFEEARPVVRLPEAMAVATAALDGGPSVRMLLLKAADERERARVRPVDAGGRSVDAENTGRRHV